MGYDRAKLQLRTTNGCGVYSERHKYDIDGIRYHSCVCGYREYDIGILLDIHSRVEKGILPFDGCYMDQPAQIMEIVDRISALKLDKELRDTKKKEMKSKESRNGRR